MKINISNFCLSICALSLPFMQALTINIGFPLKIYEVSLIFLVGYIFFSRKFILNKNNKIETYLIMCLFATLSMSVFINGINIAADPIVTSFPSRFGQIGDSIMKLVYAVIVFIGFILIINSPTKITDNIIKFWLIGAIVSAIYSWYLMIFSLIGKSVFLLPGITDPQYINLIIYNPIMRMGTFVEGNFAGLFFFLSAVLAYSAGHKLLFLFLAISTLPTCSTAAIIVVMALFIYIGFLKAFNSRLKNKIIIVSFLLVGSFGVVSVVYNTVLNTIIVSKIFAPDDEHWSGSRKERISQTTAAFNMFKANPFFGVGLSQYGYYYDEFKDSSLYEFGGDYKRIPNNVYIEILSECGIISLTILIVFLLRVIMRLTQTRNNILRAGLFGMLIYFLVFPTFSIMYVWFYLGIAINKSNSDALGVTA